MAVRSSHEHSVLWLSGCTLDSDMSSVLCLPIESQDNLGRGRPHEVIRSKPSLRAVPAEILNINKDGDSSHLCGPLFQCLTTLVVKTFSPIYLGFPLLQLCPVTSGTFAVQL